MEDRPVQAVDVELRGGGGAGEGVALTPFKPRRGISLAWEEISYGVTSREALILDSVSGSVPAGKAEPKGHAKTANEPKCEKQNGLGDGEGPL